MLRIWYRGEAFECHSERDVLLVAHYARLQDAAQASEHATPARDRATQGSNSVVDLARSA